MNIVYRGKNVETSAVSIREYLKNNESEDFASALAAKVSENLVELSTELKDGMEIQPVTFENPEGKKVLWHTTSHVLAYAVKNLYNVKLAIGPATDEGFYYDFDTDAEMNISDIEAEMKKIIKQNHKVYRKEVS